MILYLRKLRGVVPERLGRDAPAAFQHALPAVPSVLLGKGSGQVVSSGRLATLVQAGAQTRMTHLIPMLCLALRVPYSAELVQCPQQSSCEEVAAGPPVGPAPFREAMCISGLSVD